MDRRRFLLSLGAADGDERGSAGLLELYKAAGEIFRIEQEAADRPLFAEPNRG